MGRATSINAGFSIFRKVKLFESVLVFAFLEIKNKGMRDKKKERKEWEMRSWKVYFKQNKPNMKI